MSASSGRIDVDRATPWCSATRFFRHPLVTLAAGLCAFEIAFYFAYAYGMGFPHAQASPLWIPESILLCALLRSPRRYWWLFLLAPLPIRLFTSLPVDRPLWFLLGTYSVDSAKALLAASILRRVLPDPIKLESFRDLAWFGAVAALVVPAIGAFAGAALRHVLGYDYWQSWSQWFVGNALAQVVVAPAILYWVLRDFSTIRRPDPARALEIAAVFSGLVVSCYFAFRSNAWLYSPAGSVSYLPVPFLFWAAIRFGMPGATVAVPIMTIFCIDSAVSGIGAFAGYGTKYVSVLQDFLFLRSVPLYLLAVLVEQRNQADTRLRESEVRFRTMANAAPVLIWMSGLDKLCTFFNQGWLAFTGRSLEAEMGNGWVDGVHPDDVRRCFESYSSAFEARRRFEIEYRLRRHDGEYRWIMDLGVPHFDSDGAFCGYIGSAIDVTDRRQVEENKRHFAHLQRLALIGELSATIAHEVRQPLNAIMLHAGSAEALLHAPGTPLGELEEIIADIKKDAQRGEDVVGRIRSFLRRREPSIEELDINAVVSEIVHVVADDAHKRRVEIDLVLADEGLRVTGDRTQIMQVLLNLLLNGMDAMESVAAGKRRLVVRTKRLGGFVGVSVADCGTGIAPQTMPKIFESFFTTRSDGMGLGLSIAKSIIDAHDGRIWAENNGDRGATVHFTLPAVAHRGT